MAAAKLQILIMTKGVNSIVTTLISSKYNVVGIVEGFYGKKRVGYRQKIQKKFTLLKEKFRLSDKSLRKLSIKQNIPYFCMDEDYTGSLESWIKNLQPDLIVVFWLPRLLKEEIFTIPPLGTINLHPSLLPDYRGPNPFFWEYYDYNLTPGATVHYIDKGEDTGDIILQDSMRIRPGTSLTETALQVLDKMGVKLLMKTIEQIAAKQTPRNQQPAAKRPKARHVDPKEYPAMINWTQWPIEHIWHFLRGTDYWLHKSRLWTANHPGVKWSIENFEKTPANYQAAEVGCLRKMNGRFSVICNDGLIYLQPHFNVKHWVKDLLKLAKKKFQGHNSQPLQP